MDSSGSDDNNVNLSSPIAGILSNEEALGGIVLELLRTGQKVNRHSICLLLATRFEASTDPLMQARLSELLGMMLSAGRV